MILPKTLKDVCDYLTTRCGHQDLWCNIKPRIIRLGKSDLYVDLSVVSCSGKELAVFDGTSWNYILSGAMYANTNNPGRPPFVAGDFYLHAWVIKALTQTFGI